MKLQAGLPLAVLGLTAYACLLPEELEAERLSQSYGFPIAKLFYTANSDADTGFPIGTGDRFQEGAVAPQGLGTHDHNLESILNVEEVNTALKGLAKAFDSVMLFTLPVLTAEKRQVRGAIIGIQSRVLIQSGIHARERGGPDHVLYFISDLLHAQKAGTGIKYGPQTYTNEQVNKALSVGMLIVPLVNPDGVAYDQQSGLCWRKNRSRRNTTGEGIGVDLNRNFGALWDYRRLFNPRAMIVASDDPYSEVFHGTAPFSEPETTNIGWLVTDNPSLSWFLDLHSFGAGATIIPRPDPNQNFQNKTYDGKRGFLGTDPPDSVYAEFIEEEDLNAQQSIAERMGEAMSNAGSIKYRPKQSANLYPTSGGSTDYVLSRYYAGQCGVPRIHGLVVEFGGQSGLLCPFYPTKEQYHESMRQVASGLMEFLLNAAGEAGKMKVRKCEA